MSEPVELCCCYARADENYLQKKLFQHLRALDRDRGGLINLWYDRELRPGDDFASEIERHIDDAAIILLIISADFIASDYCYKKEMPRALKRHESGEARVLPIILHRCGWDVTPLARLQVLPTDGQPITNADYWHNENDALFNVVEGVKRVAHELQVEAPMKAGEAQIKAGRYDKALIAFNDAFKRAEELAKDSGTSIIPKATIARLHRGQGEALYQQFRQTSKSDTSRQELLAKILASYEKALSYDDAHLQSYEHMGKALFLLERNDEALDALDEALQQGSVDPDVYSYKYNILIKLKRVNEALAFYTQTDPTKFAEPLHLQAAKLLVDAERLEEALKAWERVTQSDAAENKAHLLKRLGRYPEALAAYEDSLALQPNNAQLQVQKGLLLELLERPQEALKAFDEAIQRQENLGQAYFGKQRIYTQLAATARAQAQERGYVGHFELMHTLRGLDKPMHCVTFSPDGRMLASADGNSTIKLWNPASGAELRAFHEEHTRTVGVVVFSPDGHFLASAGRNNTIKLWNLSSGNEFLVLRGHTGSVEGIAFSPDGHVLASGSRDHTIKLWNLSSGNELLALRKHTSAVNSVAISPDGHFLVSGSNDNAIKLWSIPSPDRPWDLRELQALAGHPDHVLKVVVSSDSRFLASVSADKTIKLWSLLSGNALPLQLLKTLKGHTSVVWDVAFSPDSRFLASASADKTIKLWDFVTGNELYTLREHSGQVRSVVFSPDGYTLASGSEDGTIKLWRLQ